MFSINNQRLSNIQKSGLDVGQVEDQKVLENNYKDIKIYPNLLNDQHSRIETTNQNKSIQIQQPQIDNRLSKESEISKNLNSNLNINLQSNIQQNQNKMTIYLQTPNNESYLNLKSTKVQLINSTKKTELKLANHYQEDANHPLLRNWKKENVEQKLYLYSQKQLSEIQQLNQNEFLLIFENDQGSKKLQFTLPQDSDVFFIDSSTLEDKLNQDDKAYNKQINSECLTEFALQLLLKDSFVKFIKFCNQFDTKFNRGKFVNQLISFGFKDANQEFDLKTFLIFLFAQSVNKELSIITPRIKIYDIFINLYKDESDRKRISQASDQLNNCKDWHAIKKLIEEVFLNDATFEQSKDYYKIKNTFNLNICAKAIFMSKIKTEFEPNLNEIFNQEYMDDSGMTTEDYRELFIGQTFQIKNENALQYLEQNISLINFLFEKTQKFDIKAYENVKKTVYSVVIKYFNNKDLIETQKLLRSKKQIFEKLHIESDYFLKQLKFNEKLLEINLEDIKQEDIQIFDSILNSQNNNLDVLLQILSRIKVLNLDEKSTMNKIFETLNKKIVHQMQQINQGQDQQQKMGQLKQILYKIFINNWNNLENSQKIKQSIKFEVCRYDFQRQYKQQLVEEEKSLFTFFIQNQDIIQNILEIDSSIQKELELPQDVKSKLIEKMYEILLEKIYKIEDNQEFCKFLKNMGDDSIKQKVFEKNSNLVIKSLQDKAHQLIQKGQIKQMEEWNIQYILEQKVFELLFSVLINKKDFNKSEIFSIIKQIISKNENLQGTTWKDYKKINEKKDIFKKFIEFCGIKKTNGFEVFETFYNQYSKLKCFIQLMKNLNVTDIDDQKQLLDSVDKDENQEVKAIQEKFNKIIDENNSLIGTSQYLVDLKLFDQISNTYSIKNQTIDETMNQINSFALPFLESIYRYLLEQEFPDLVQDFQNEEIEQFKNDKDVQTRNCYQFLNTHFKDHFSLNKEILFQEYENLSMICEQKFQKKISSTFFIQFIQQGYHKIIDYELLTQIQKTAKNLKMVFPPNYQKQLESLQILISSQDLSKKQFFEGTQQIQVYLDTYINETVQNCENRQVDRKFLKDQIIPFISPIFNVMDLHSNFKNEVDLQELLFDDDNDLANRIQHYIQIKKYLEEFNKSLNSNIFVYIQQIILFFYKDEKCKEIRQKIEDISKFKDYIQQKFMELGKSQAQNSVKVLQMFMQFALIHINVNDAYLEKNQSQKVNKQDRSQAYSYQQQGDERNYKVTYKTQKKVNNKEKTEEYNEEQIFQIIQRLNIISGQQLDEAYKSETEKEQFKENRKRLEEIYTLIQKNLIQILEKYIQYGYLDGFIKEIDILIDDKQSNIESVIKNIENIVEEKENQIQEWKLVIEEAQKQYPFLKLIIPQCYPDILRYFQKLLNVNANQNSSDTIKNSIKIKHQQFGQSNSMLQFNVEEMITFYHMNTESLAKELLKNKDQIRLNTINEKISLLGQYLNKQFQQEKKVLKISDKTFRKNQYDKLEASKIQCESYGDLCKQLLLFFGDKNKQPDKLQFFFANQQTTEMDIEAFLNRVIYFEMENESRHFFIIDFKKLKYQVQKFATEQIDKYMNTEDKQFQTKNKLIILYLFNQNNEYSNDQDDETTEDCIRIPLTEEYKRKTPQYQNQNIHLFKSHQAGVGKTFQIQKQIELTNQLLINIPAHQFQNIDNLLKILRSKRKQIQNQQQIHGIHIEIIYDQQDKISLLLFQILVLKCISFNQNKFFNFSSQSHFYVEQSNYYGIKYANILTHIQSIQSNTIYFNLSQLSVSNQFTSDDQTMLRYLNGLKQGAQYLMDKDFVRFEAFPNQKVENKKIFTDTEAIQLIQLFFNKYMEEYKIKQNLTYQHIVMFKQQFVTQIKEMEQDPNYTSYQIKELMNNASPEQIENIKQLRYNIINIFLEQSLKNTFLNSSNQNQSQNSKNYYETYMKELYEKISNEINIQPKTSKYNWNYKQYQTEGTNTISTHQNIQKQNQQNRDSSTSLLTCLNRLFSCFKNTSSQKYFTSPSLQQSEMKYLIKAQTSDHKDNNKVASQIEIENLKLSDDEERIQQMNTILQYDQAIKNLIFFINGSIIAAIFKDDREDQIILKLEQLMRTFISQVNRISNIKINIDEELQLRIPHIGQTEDEYTLLRTLVYICSRNPSKFIDEKSQQQKPELSRILQERAFTKDNTCKLIQIAFKIYSGVPLVIMGETGIGKTVNIQILTEIMGFSFEVLRLSAGTTVDQIIKFMKDIKKKYHDNSKVVIFFDEINTNQNIYGLLKEIFFDKSVNGKKIFKNNQNLVCIAACNPYEYVLKKNQNGFEAGYLTRIQLEKTKKANLTYHVYPLPESMLPFVVNYGQLEEKVEEKNIYQMLKKINFRSKYTSQSNQLDVNMKKNFDNTVNIFSEEELSCIQQLIMASQQYIRCQQGTSRSASLRDISRTIKFIEYFMKVYFLKRGDTNTQTQKQKSCILALYLCYQIRLNSQKQREEYQKVIQYIQSKYEFFNKINNPLFFDKTINEELDFFINQLKIDSKLISKNRALKENCFCIALCILTKTPLFITGEPGTSKTLSFTLVINSFKGISSSSQFLQGFPSIKEFYIQGNLQTQSEEIRQAFQQAKQVKTEGILPVVFFDEAGQAELSENNPNKVLHELLDEGDVSFIASSNYSLDYAKQNRCLHLQRNKNNLEDLKEFVNQLVCSNTSLKTVLKEFCQIYFNFHGKLKNYIHNSRDFYFTIKYCVSMFNKNPSIFQEEKDLVNLLYRAMIKNFSGYDQNTNLIIEEFKKIFQKYKDDIQQVNTLEIIEECFKPICEDFVYHSRFPMLITDNTDQGIQFAKLQLEKNKLQSQVKAGSHFKKDYYEDKTREISSINASIEQNYSIISVNQDYIYAVYYDFFTMNFSRIGDKQKFRLNYKQIQTRIEVPQNYLFIMIVTKDQYMKMDLALLNRFEKHVFSEKLIFQKQQKAIIDNIMNEFKIIKQPFQKDKNFLSFIKKSYIFGMIQAECKKLEESQYNLVEEFYQKDYLLEKCKDLIGNLSKKYDIIRLRNKDTIDYFNAWNQKIYLDNLIEFIKFEKNKQKKDFHSIIYTNSYLYSNYKVLLKEIGFETLLIDLSLIKQKFVFQQQTEDYYQGNYNLMIIKISCLEENPQNIYYVRSFINECRQKYQNIKQKSIIIIIQYSNSQHYRLPFCLEWEQYQIDNLLPYAYTQSSLQKSSEIQEINQILNYRNIHGKNERQILENKKIFSYFTQMHGFCSKLIQRMTFRFEPDKEQFYQYYESIREILEKHFQGQNSFVYNHFYDYFVQYLKQNSDQDDVWSYKFDLIKGLNYEKQMINYLKNKVESVLLIIFSKYEDQNLLTNFHKIQKLPHQKQNLYMGIFQKYINQTIQISDGSEIKRIPYIELKFIFSNIIYNKIEQTKKIYESNDTNQVYQNHFSEEVKIFKDILNFDNLNDYIEDYLFYRDIKLDINNNKIQYYAIFCDKLLKQLNQKKFFKEYYNIHELFWNNEKILTEILDLIYIFNCPQKTTDLAQFLVDKEVFVNKKDILENVSEYYYLVLQKMQNVQIQQIEHFIRIFPLQKSAQRFQIISQCYKSYGNLINIKEISKILKEGYENDTFENKNFNQNEISLFLVSLGDNNNINQIDKQYLQLYLLKLIFNEDSSFLKKIQSNEVQKRPQFLFIDGFKKVLQSNSFDPYEFPWCKENYIKKLDELEQNKQNFLVLATLKMMKQEIRDSLFNEQQIQIYNKTQNLKNQSSLVKFIIYLASTVMDQNDQINQFRQFIGPQSSQFIQKIYIPFNSLTKQQIQAIEIKNVLDSVKDKTKVYQCTCGFVYAVGNCGKNMVTVKCNSCNKNIGGANHININQEYQQQNIQEQIGFIHEFIEDKYFAPRQIDPLAFRFGNLVIYCLMFISSNKNQQDEKNYIEKMTNQWKIIKEFLKLTDEQLLVIAVQLLQQLLNIKQNDFTILNNRNQFEQEFSLFCKNFPSQIKQILEEFDKHSKAHFEQEQKYQLFQSLIRDKVKTVLFYNTLQYYQIPQFNELEGQYLKRDYKYRFIIQNKDNISKIKYIYPLIYFYKKIHQFYSKKLTEKISESYTLQKIVENKPYLLKYYDENVKECWNKLCEFYPQMQIGCKVQPTQKLETADQVPLGNFLIIKKENETQASGGDQLHFFITEITSLQNNVLNEIKNLKTQPKEIFELYDDDMITISQNFNTQNLIYFENLQLEIGQQNKNMNTKLLKNYYIFDQLLNKSLIKEFQDSNYFEIKKDTKNLGIIYSNNILQGIDVQKIKRLNPKTKEKFLKQCLQQEQKFEIREQLFLLHDLMKKMPQQKIEPFLKNNLYIELEKNGFIEDESYFKECLRYFEVCELFDLLVILETELMDDLVQNLDKTYKDQLSENMFENFIKKFKQRVLDVLNKNSNDENEIKSNKDLQLILGRYIIRNLIAQKQQPNTTEQNIFEYINYFPDQQYLDPLLLPGEDEVKFEDLEIKHKYIFNLYERLSKDFKQQLDLKQKQLQSQKQEISKNINNQQMKIFGFEMEKKQLNGKLNNINEHVPQNNNDGSDDDDDDDDDNNNDDAV
ncbi:AAA domain, dynein subfamily protein (macronuclear) [Tetrahymena thermophila SB210]|uniref:AAA domain, dynein subfamily protein n=1 Tax=Tetrahymena thermophila (strain SB210) TaxID=312017 RepID=Q22MZ2_TETTS|nr:AAA domain, dynein subfamily protein [Tetrahymena thermophila SB210]EAR86280.2 AAA domain, dynein subfamily protein [Tetrahymena thermophila SB210]|eukprot:XP_976878.2 AAA domain, dynein subfamily protein [Tetrahymena thermophila SB210]